MKTVRILLFALLALCLAGLLASCMGAVAFHLNFVVDGEVYATVDTKGQEMIAIPENPIKEGTEFDGWYWDNGEWTRPFTANSLLDTPLSSDMRIYAKWKSDVPKTPDATTQESGTDVADACLHDWDVGVDMIRATYEKEGTRLFTCNKCGKKKTEVIPKIDANACQHTWDAGKVTVAATCGAAGEKTLTCTKCKFTKVDAIPKTGEHKLTSYYLSAEPTSTALAKRDGICSVCGAHATVDDTSTTNTYANYQTRLNNSKTKIDGYGTSDFGGSSYSTMSTSKYNAPTASPKSNEHPRVLFNTTTLASVRAAMKKPENADKLRSLISTANDYSSGVPHGNTQGYDGEDYLEEILQTIRAKAFLYQMTGVKLYGYDAIRMMKEFITTFKIADTSDPCRRYGEVMFTTAQVYDWCNPLLSAADKKQFIIGVEKKCGPGMEVGFPPSGQNAVSGHGCERQILRDYLSFAIAIYDDEPTWYKYIAGRFYQEFVPVRNEYYKSGYTPQGISNYIPIRFGSDLWSAWLIETATGKFPYASKANMQQVMHSVYAHTTKQVSDNGKTVIFSEGDHQGRSGKEAMKQLALPSMISAYLFNDATAMGWAEFAEYAYFPATYYMILKSKGTGGTASQRYEGLDLITYNGGFVGQMIAHSNWQSDSASVYMKIGNRMTANHDHADSGSFQIFYKSLLAGDSGYYDKYESDHHLYYHQATIAHNSIVLKSGSTIVGQKQPSEAGSYSTWQGTTYTMGTTTGYAYGYTDTAQTKPKYAYIAGDIADAYYKTKINNLFGWITRSVGSSSELSRCDRRMLAVYDTGNAKAPMYFFVYDNITSKSDYQKVFLLHTVKEPSISGSKVTVTNDSGRLVLQNVAGNCSITKVGGAKPANWTVGSKTYALTGSRSGGDDGYWGRAEITTPSGKSNVMLNAMYVCDAGNDPSLSAKTITSTKATGAVLGNVVAVFADSASPETSSFSFTASGSGTLSYYVSGVKAGTWKITVGSTTKTATATSDGGLLVFTAPAGTVTLTPQ